MINQKELEKILEKNAEVHGATISKNESESKELVVVVNGKKMILTSDMNLVSLDPELTAKEMFKNIKLFGKTAHYTRVGYDPNTDEPLVEDEKPYDFGDIVVEWITPSKRALISFDMQRKDFFTFVTEQDACEGAAYNGIISRPMDMNIIIHKAIQKQLEELGW